MYEIKSINNDYIIYIYLSNIILLCIVAQVLFYYACYFY